MQHHNEQQQRQHQQQQKQRQQQLQEHQQQLQHQQHRQHKHMQMRKQKQQSVICIKSVAKSYTYSNSVFKYKVIFKHVINENIGVLIIP